MENSQIARVMYRTLASENFIAKVLLPLDEPIARPHRIIVEMSLVGPSSNLLSPASKVLDDFVRPTICHQFAMWCGRLRPCPGVAACRWLRFPEPLAAKFSVGID